MGGAATPAVAMLLGAGVAHRVHQYTHDPAVASFGQEAAEAMGVEPGRVFKTLVASADGALVVAVVPVTAELDTKALAAVLGAKKVALADPAVAERTTGYVVGGISPLGQKRRVRTVIDATASRWESVFVSGGRRGLELELAPADLVRLTGAQLAPLGRAKT